MCVNGGIARPAQSRVDRAGHHRLRDRVSGDAVAAVAGAGVNKHSGMPRYIAFLRAINVGGRVVKMERLRALFEELNLSKVETFIASGNVVFEANSKSVPALERKIEVQLQKSLGYEVTTIIRTDTELTTIAKHRAFSAAETNADGAVVYVAFLKEEPAAAASQSLTNHRGAIDEFKIDGREIYWLCRTRFSESEFSGARLEKTLGMRTTVRNSTTVRKLAAKYPSGAKL